jgi:hypothetical protein
LAAHHFLNHPDRVKEFYFVLIIETERPPWVLTRYKSQLNLHRGLTHHGLFQVNEDIGSLLSRGMGWLSWGQVKKIFEINRLQSRTPVEKRFVEDLIVFGL